MCRICFRNKFTSQFVAIGPKTCIVEVNVFKVKAPCMLNNYVFGNSELLLTSKNFIILYFFK